MRKPIRRQLQPQWQYPANPVITWDCMDCITIEEEEWVDIKDQGETADKYWANGWTLSINSIHRSDHDSDARGRYHRVYPTRYFTSQIKITKSLRRVLVRNRDLRIVTRPLRVTPAKENLYLVHHLSRFGRPPHETLGKRYKYSLHHPARYMETCYFLGEQLIAFSIFEAGYAAMWSNLGAWSPEHAARSLGTLTILKEVEYARKSGMVFYYLGHYFPFNPFYEYKTRFGSLELYDWDNKGWVAFDSARAQQMIREPMRRRSD